MSPLEIFGLLKGVIDLWKSLKEKEGVETNFGSLIQRYLDDNKEYKIIIEHIEQELIKFYPELIQPEDCINFLYEQIKIDTEEVRETFKDVHQKSRAIKIAMESLKGNTSREEFSKIDRKLRHIEPFLVFLERSLSISKDYKEKGEILKTLKKMKFSDDAELDHKFRRMFFMFMTTFEKTAKRSLFINVYLGFGPTSTIETIIPTMINKVFKKHREYYKRFKIASEGYFSHIDVSKSEEELSNLRNELFKKENDKNLANAVIHSFISLRHFVFASYYGLFIFLLAWSEKFIDRTYTNNILDKLEMELKAFGKNNNLWL